MSLAALALFGLYIDLGLGQGGMERLILYPVLIWIMTLGAPLASQIQVTGKAVS